MEETHEPRMVNEPDYDNEQVDEHGKQPRRREKKSTKGKHFIVSISLI